LNFGSAAGLLFECLGLTVLLEEAAAFLFRIRGIRNYILIALINVVTNMPAVVLAFLFEPAGGVGRILFIAAAEAAVIVCEGIFYRKCGEGFAHPYLYSLFFNLISYTAGTLILCGIRMTAS
jgi:hypothetical protein